MDPTVVKCWVTIALFIRHIFNKEIKKQVVGEKLSKPSDMQWP